MKKEKRNKKLKILIGIFSVILIICCVLLFIEIFSKASPIKGKYSKEVITVLDNNNLLDKANKLDYSPTLEIMIKDDYFNKKHFDDYYLVDYHEYEGFSKHVSQLLEKEYEPEKINYLMSNQTKELINKIITLDKFEIDYLKIKDFDLDKLARYKEFNSYVLSFEEIVKAVNHDIDIKKDEVPYDSANFYINIKPAIDPHSDITLVNKAYVLDKSFVPNDLVNFESKSISKRVVEPLKEMFEYAKEAGYHLCTISSYRSYNTQTSLFYGYIKRDGRAHAERYSAKPGHSEHQLGLATDLCTTNGKRITVDSPVYPWLENNAHKFGFIIRFPKGKTGITGYNFEPWHVRYIGKEHATKVKELDITYDEYYEIFLKER
ncbi:MAG: M15 family metallopeptidase [Mollicutes bacterium]|nr:M15 family metallopeptidase [Mollicutes bacterium]